MLREDSSLWFINANARSNEVFFPFHAQESGAASGRQRKQGLKPLLAAATEVRKYSILLSLGAGAGQIGRQNIPVVFTATKNWPSKRASRDNLAC